MTPSRDRLVRFTAVVDHGSFSHAARQLGVSQPALSASIRQLEASLGVLLLDRGRHGAVTTAPGALLYERAKRAEAELAAAMGEIRTLGLAQRQRLSVGAISGSAAALVCTTICTLIDARSRLAIEIADEPSERVLIDRLSKEDLDLVICPSITGNATRGLRHERLFRSRRIAVIRSSHPLAGKRNLTLGDMVSYPFVHLDPATSLHRVLDNLFRNLGLPAPKQNVIANSIAAGKQIVLGSDAFSIFSESSIMAELESGALIGCPFTATADDWWNLFWSKHVRPSPQMREFVTNLLKFCEEKKLETSKRLLRIFATGR